MKELIQHIVRTRDFERIAARSRKDCHIKGVDSYVICENPTIRMFHAKPGHEMVEGNVAIHDHHCDITLVSLVGNLFQKMATDRNANIYANSQLAHVRGYHKYKYSSQIKNGAGGFEYLHDSILAVDRAPSLVSGSCFLKAEEMHTTMATPRMHCIWLVIQGKENPHYKSVCYSHKDLEEEKFEGMYRPTSPEDVESAFSLVKKYLS